MKKSMLALGLAACAVSFFAACKKDTTTTTPTTTTGTATVSGHTMSEFSGADSVTTDFFGAQGNILGTTSIDADSTHLVQAFFIFNGNAKPAAGNYTISASNTAGHVSVAYFYYTTTGEGLYTSGELIATTPVTATVTNNNGKIAVTVPAVAMGGLFTPSAAGSSTQNDTTTISGTFTEK